VFVPTRPTAIPIGERRRPDPRGEPGHLRVDSVHQEIRTESRGLPYQRSGRGDAMGSVGCAEGISERFLIPVLEAMLHQFPFRILGFHSDNGSEYVNYNGARLLNKLLIEFTRSRPNRSQDNGLVEGKNGR